MFDKPEELMMAVLAACWTVLSFFICRYAGATFTVSLLVCLLTLIWAVVFFLLWQRNYTRFVWPVFLGLLTFCWWPFLNWFALRHNLQAAADPVGSGALLPFYAGTAAKAFYALLPVAAGYLFKWKRNRNRKNGNLPADGLSL